MRISALMTALMMTSFLACDAGFTTPDPAPLSPNASFFQASGARDRVDLDDYDANNNNLVCVKSVPSSGKAASAAGSRTIVKDDTDGVCPGGFMARQLFQAAFITAGQEHACMLDQDGRAYCWGSNSDGQLGTGAVTRSSVPIAVATTKRFTAIHAGKSHSCGLSIDSRVLCWGSNHLGQLGDGTVNARSVPQEVAGGHGFEALDVGPFHACALTASGEAFCWGMNRRSRLGHGSTETCFFSATFTVPCTTAPRQVATARLFESITAGLGHTCGVADDGSTYCWGNLARNEGGSGVPTIGPTPVAVASPPNLAIVRAGTRHSCGVDGAGAAYCWGTYHVPVGYAGNGNLTGEPTPDPVAGGHRFEQLVTSDADWIFTYSCALDGSDAAWCWGSNAWGQLGTDVDLPDCFPVTYAPSPTCSSVPVAVKTALTWRMLTVGAAFTCGITTDGAPYCWGRNAAGNLGDGTTDDRALPGPVSVSGL